MFDRYEFKPGDRVARADGAWGEVLSVSEAGDALRIRYTGDGGDPSMPKTEDLVATNEIVSLSPAPAGPGWGSEVIVVVHHVPESGGFEGGYEATTMMGVPEGVVVTGTDGDSAEGALNHLMAGLRAFGFSGRVAVEDTTVDGGVRRYEVEAP